MGQAHIIDESVDARRCGCIHNVGLMGTLGGCRTTIPKARRATTTTGEIATERRNLRLRPTPTRLASHLTKTQDSLAYANAGHQGSAHRAASADRRMQCGAFSKSA